MGLSYNESLIGSTVPPLLLLLLVLAVVLRLVLVLALSPIQRFDVVVQAVPPLLDTVLGVNCMLLGQLRFASYVLGTPWPRTGVFLDS